MLFWRFRRVVHADERDMSAEAALLPMLMAPALF